MIGFSHRIESNFERVERAEEDATFRNIRHAAFSLSKTAKQSIIKSDQPSEEGSPPHTRGRGRQSLKKAIFVDADEDSAVIGPRESWVGESGAAHEFGEEFKGDPFDDRPFMGPALEASLSRFADSYRGSIGE